MNETRQNITGEQSQTGDSRIENLLEAGRVADIDNARIKRLVHARILGYEAARRSRRRMMWAGWVSAAACVAVIVSVAFGFMGRDNIDLSVSTDEQIADAGYTEISVPAGRRVELKLSDGTRLVANSNTRVVYPETFEGPERRIYADGEVFLEVAKDACHPFVVESNGFEVKVLGTTFDICTANDGSARVVLVEGSIELSTDSKECIRLKPSDMAVLTNGEIASLSKVDTYDYTLWVDGMLSLRGETLSHLIERLNRHYNVTITCDESLSPVKVYGKLDLRDSIEQVIEALGEIVPMDVETDGSLITMKTKL